MYRTLIGTQQLEALDAPLILDCRFDLADPSAGERAYEEAHLPGAIYAHLDRNLSSPITPVSGRHPLPDPQRLMGALLAAGLTPGRQVVVYDAAGGATAARAWWLLRWLGHEAVAVLDGGWQAWCAEQRPLEEGRGQSLVSDQWGAVEPARQMLIEVAPLQKALAEGQILLVDARAAERFRGEVEPLDPVAGHVPGAVNAPLGDNLDGTHFLPRDQLRQRWLQVLQGRRPQEVVHMCGSGVTACHNLLAMEHAGLGGSRLYPGSWSQWIRDPQRPVARGAGCR